MPVHRFGGVASFVLISTFAGWIFAEDSLPRSTDPRLKIELFAESPRVVTPTGIDVDRSGRVWVIESNTPFPPEGYKGHPTDRILVMEGRDKDGHADEIAVFRRAAELNIPAALAGRGLDPFSSSIKGS